ncbi:BTAD domain-containing putative transcriptional regulator [Wenjunlia tyrosinilytica]|uniref:OmpR/PhoB-type domain-containing protein n=1 Tax=Wenjunlia tyrosinilytica TaxID=1544741 RepID=A0A917ZU85_9ACTN|nr:BTAD domain-containing putative transcriptional regulator [Wenjunlia tyrosinilytica]GGO93267.1 hypothetical protein GCM10012280_45400 [Wenjunlia tyrosinilytica]
MGSVREQAFGSRPPEYETALDAPAPGRWLFDVLGPLRVHGPAGSVALGPPQRRVLLLRLLAEHCRPVSVDRLCEDLWDGRPPSAARSCVHAHISRIRSALAADPGACDGVLAHTPALTHTSAGYTLHVEREQRDTALFEGTAQRAKALAAEGNWTRARTEAEGALALWRGRPYSDAEERSFARGEARRLSELRWATQELLAGLLLEEGAVIRSIAVAEEMVARDPLREVSWAVLLRGLYLAGRPAEALRRFETVRRLLAEDLGTEPGPALRQVHMAILRHDTGALRATERRSADVTAVAGATGRMRSPGARAVGREAELSRLTGLLSAAHNGITRWAVVSGAAGMGKTRLLEALAREAEQRGSVVHWVRHTKRQAAGGSAPDRTTVTGPLPARGTHENPSGSGSGDSPAIVLGSSAPVLRLVDDLHHATAAEMDELAAWSAQPRDAPSLLVCAVDRFGAPGAAELLAALDHRGAEHLELQPLTAEDVRDLLRSNADADAAAGHPAEEAAALHHLTGGNPFLLTELLRLPAARRTGPHLSLPGAVRAAVRDRLHALAPRARRVLETAAVAGEDLDVAVLAATTSLPGSAVLACLEAAAESGLVVRSADWTPRGPGTYRFPCELVRQALRADLKAPRVREVHAVLYRVLSGRPDSDAEAVAEHAVAAGPLVGDRELSSAALQAGYTCLDRCQVDRAGEWMARALAGHAGSQRLRAALEAALSRTGAAPQEPAGADSGGNSATAGNNVIRLPVRRA